MNFQAFLDSLSFMGIGMASIIIVIAVLVISVILLNLFTSKKVKTSRKIIFLSALVIAVIGLSLLNGITKQNKIKEEQTRIENEIKEYISTNEEEILLIFDEYFATSSLIGNVEYVEKGFKVTFVDELTESVPAEKKAEIQKYFESYEVYFEEILTEIQSDKKEIETYTFVVCDKNNDPYITIVADGK